MMRKFLASFLFLTAVVFYTGHGSILHAQDNLLYITYGKYVPLTSGDDNFRQAFFIKIPEASADKFYIRIFDIDCGGEIDEPIAEYNTETAFSLYGGKGAVPDNMTLSGSVIENEKGYGKLLYSKNYSANPQTDNQWITYSAVNKTDGELKEGYYNFKLVVEGIQGNDGNIYDIFLSGNELQNINIEGAELYCYSPTIRHAVLEKISEAKFLTDTDSRKITAYNFDLDDANIFLETALRTNIQLNSSGDGVWQSNIVELNEFEINNYCAINLSRKKDQGNDLTIYVKNSKGKFLPITLPIKYKTPNNKPVIKTNISSSELWSKILFDASNSSDADGNKLTYKWFFGDGNTADGVKVEHDYKRSDQFTGMLLVKDNSGSVNNASLEYFTVRLNEPPIPRAGKDTVVSASSVQLDASASNDKDGVITKYVWDFGDGSTSTDINPVHVYANPGTYNTTLTISDNSGLNNNLSSESIKIVINQKPIADAGPDIIAEPGEVLHFNGGGSVDPDGSIIDYNWDFGDSTEAKGITASHSYKRPGKYSVRLGVLDNTGDKTAIDFDEAIITVNAKPVVNAGNDVVAAPGDIIEFNSGKALDPDNNSLKYIWEFSDGLQRTESQTVKRSFTNSGLYKAVLTVIDNSGAKNNSASDELLIKINTGPVAVAGKDILTCSHLINFDASASGDADGDPLKYTWNFGDGSSEATGEKVTHAYANYGSFPAVLTVDDGLKLKNSVSKSSITVTINEPPVADAGEDLAICAGEIVPFDGGKSYDPEKGLLKYFWDFGDGTKAEGINPIKSYSKGGIYQVLLTVEDESGLECNTHTDSKLITVIESPVAHAGGDMEICANQEVQFDGSKSTDADGVVNSYTWDFGDGTTGGGASPKHTYKKGGAYKVVLVITGETQGHCDNTSADEINVVVHEAPVADFSLPSSFPVNEDVAFDASTSMGGTDTIIKYGWDFGDSTKAEGQKISHKFKKSGLHFVTLTVSTNSKTICSSSSTVKSILINDRPVADAGDNIQARVNDPVIFNASKSYDPDGSITSYSWDLGDGTSAEGRIVNHKYTKTGTYKATLRVKDNTQLSNNEAEAGITVTVVNELTITINSKDNGCIDQKINFEADISGNISDSLITYTWDFGSNEKIKGKNVQYSFSKGGEHNISLSAESKHFEFAKVLYTSKTIMINNPPVINTLQVVYACPGEEISFDASKSLDPDGDKLKYSWEINGEYIPGSKVSHSFNRPGEYLVKLLLEDDSNTDCNSSEENIKVIINSSPAAITGRDIKGFTGGAYDAVLFDASQSYDEDGDALIYEWNFGDGEKGAGSKVFHNYKKAGVYSASLKVSDGKNSGCSSSLVEIKVTINDR